MYYRNVPVSKTLIRKGISEPGRYFLLKRDTVLNAGVFSIHKLFSHFSSYLAKLLPEKFNSSAGSWALPALGTAAGHSHGGHRPGVSLPCLKQSYVTRRTAKSSLLLNTVLKNWEKMKTTQQSSLLWQVLNTWYCHKAAQHLCPPSVSAMGGHRYLAGAALVVVVSFLKQRKPLQILLLSQR